MENSKKIIIAEVIIIIILTIFIFIVDYRISEFKRDCKLTYNLNDKCPCKPTKQTSLLP